MKCNIEWLSTYLDGALTDDKRAKLEEHLKTCEVCAAKLDEFARVEQTAKKIPVPRLSEAYWENFANRVQNKLAIQERRKTPPAWLEALKNFFQPTAGKLAIAGGVAVILLLTFVGLEQWEKQTFRPPVFEADTPAATGKIDSVQIQAKDESEFQTAEKNKKVGLIEEKRLGQPEREKGMATLTQKPVESRPAAAAPVGRALAAPQEQKSKEEPSLAAFAERDDAIRGDTVLVTAGKKAEIRKEVAMSQVKVGAEEIEKLPVRNDEDRLKLRAGRPVWKDSLSLQNSQAVSKEGLKDLNLTGISEYGQSVQGDTLTATSGRKPEVRKELATSPVKVAPRPLSPSGLTMAMPSIDTVQLIADIRQVIAEKEKELTGSVSNPKAESLYIFLGDYYSSLYRFSQKPGDWNKANRRVNDFLKKDLSNSTRQRLLEIQAELKKLKK